MSYDQIIMCMFGCLSPTHDQREKLLQFCCRPKEDKKKNRLFFLFMHFSGLYENNLGFPSVVCMHGNSGSIMFHKSFSATNCVSYIACSCRGFDIGFD